MQQIDLLPTLLDALDIETPASGARGGRSLLPLLDRARAEPRESREQAIVSLVDVDGGRWQSVRSAEWRLIRRPGPVA